MAITFQKQPLSFFNVNEPAIFEFTSDEDLGVNPNDLVADLELKNLWHGGSYVIKNILPKYGTGVFRIDVSSYLKALLLDSFNYDWTGGKQFAIQRYQIGVSVHAENGADIFGDSYVFDSGYIFDTTFIFAEESPNDTETNTDFYPMVGMTYRSESPKPQLDPTKLNILLPKYSEYAVGFQNNVHVLVGDVVDLPGTKSVVVAGIPRIIPAISGGGKGISYVSLTDAQIEAMYLPSRINTNILINTNIEVYGISYKPSDCEETLQFRFYNSYAGYSYFYSAQETHTANRGKTDFINNDFYNQQENKSPRSQRAADYTEALNLTGIKRIELQELFRELLRSPKVEVLLPQGYTECEVKGNFNLRPLDFEYNLTVTISNDSQMTL